MTSIMFKRCVFLWRYVSIERRRRLRKNAKAICENWLSTRDRAIAGSSYVGRHHLSASSTSSLWKAPSTCVFAIEALTARSVQSLSAKSFRRISKNFKNSRDSCLTLSEPFTVWQTSHHMLRIVGRMFRLRRQPSTSLCHSCERQLFNLNFWSICT